MNGINKVLFQASLCEEEGLLCFVTKYGGWRRPVWPAVLARCCMGGWRSQWKVSLGGNNVAPSMLMAFSTVGYRNRELALSCVPSAHCIESLIFVADRGLLCATDKSSGMTIARTMSAQQLCKYCSTCAYMRGDFCTAITVRHLDSPSNFKNKSRWPQRSIRHLGTGVKDGEVGRSKVRV